MIALLCPTRQRPEQCERMIESAAATSKAHVNIQLGVQGAQYHIELPRGSFGISQYSIPDGMPTAHTWNYLASFPIVQQSPLVMLAADDMIFTTPRWDRAIIEHYNALPDGKKAHVYALRDSRDENGTPHPIVTREWIETMGYFVPPIFLHWFVDSWTVEIAKANDCFTHFKDYELMHLKPSDEGKPDETHSRIRSMGWHSRDQYVAETCKDWLELQKAKLQNYFDNQKAMTYKVSA